MSRVMSGGMFRREVARRFTPATIVLAEPGASLGADRMVAAGTAAAANTAFRPTDRAFAAEFFAARTNALSTSVKQAPQFFKGVLGVVRRSSLPSSDFDHGSETTCSFVCCVLCCRACATGKEGKHTRRGYEVSTACRTCGVQLCNVVRPGQWPGDASCHDRFHRIDALDEHPFAGRCVPKSGAQTTSSSSGPDPRSAADRRARRAPHASGAGRLRSTPRLASQRRRRAPKHHAESPRRCASRRRPRRTTRRTKTTTTRPRRRTTWRKTVTRRRMTDLSRRLVSLARARELGVWSHAPSTSGSEKAPRLVRGVAE